MDHLSAMDSEAAISHTRDEVLRDCVILCVRLGPGVSIVEVCRAAARGGLRILEITLTTPGAWEAIRTLAPEESLLVGPEPSSARTMLLP